MTAVRTRLLVLGVVLVGSLVLIGSAIGDPRFMKVDDSVTVTWSGSDFSATGPAIIGRRVVDDACGGTGTFRISEGNWAWESTVVLQPSADVAVSPTLFVKGKVSLRYTVSGTAANGVTYTGSGRASTTDFHGGANPQIQTTDSLRGTDGSVLEIQQTWNAQYTSGPFMNGLLDAGGITYDASGGTCTKSPK